MVYSLLLHLSHTCCHFTKHSHIFEFTHPLSNSHARQVNFDRHLLLTSFAGVGGSDNRKTFHHSGFCAGRDQGLAFARKIGQVRPVSFSFVALQRQFTDRSIKWLDQTRGNLLKLDIRNLS